MVQTFAQLRNKEMICVRDGFKIGLVDDVEFDPETREILSFISYGKGRLFGLLGKYEDIRITCEQVEVIGEDIILVRNYDTGQLTRPRRESIWSRLFE